MQRMNAGLIDQTADFHHRIVRQEGNGALVGHVDHHLGIHIVINRIDKANGHFGISAAPLSQNRGLVAIVGIRISIIEPLFQLLNLLTPLVKPASTISCIFFWVW